MKQVSLFVRVVCPGHGEIHQRGGDPDDSFKLLSEARDKAKNHWAENQRELSKPRVELTTTYTL